MDICATARAVLTPVMGCQPIPVDLAGPLPKDSVGLIIGRSSTTLKGLTVHPGVIDQDFEGQIKVLCSSPRGICAITPGDRIAQLLILPSLHRMFPSKEGTRGTRAFGSSGGQHTFLSLQLDHRPMMDLIINGKTLPGLLDTGADTSIVSTSWWPADWPLTQSSQSLQGLGYADTPSVSASTLHWKDSEGHQGTFTPYVLPLPINLWGRDVLEQMNFRLTNEYSLQSQQMMTQMKYIPGKGLGKMLQGRTSPITIKKKEGRMGLGFS